MAKSKKSKRDRAVAPKRPTVATATTDPDIDGAATLADEYSYVSKDLRHLSIISIVLFIVMLGVGFFI